MTQKKSINIKHYRRHIGYIIMNRGFKKIIKQKNKIDVVFYLQVNIKTRITLNRSKYSVLQITSLRSAFLL